MYPGPVRHSGGLNLAAQNFVGAAQYADYGGYHVNLDGAQSPGPAWPAPYAAPLRDDWGAYGQGAPPPAAAAAAAVHGLNGGSPAAAMAYSPADFHHHHHHHHPHAHHHAGPAPHCSAGGMQPLGTAPAAAAVAAASAAPEPLSPGGQRRGLCEWVRKPAQATLGSQGKRGVRDGGGGGGGPKPTRSGAAPRWRLRRYYGERAESGPVPGRGAGPSPREQRSCGARRRPGCGARRRMDNRFAVGLIRHAEDGVALRSARPLRAT